MPPGIFCEWPIPLQRIHSVGVSLFPVKKKLLLIALSLPFLPQGADAHGFTANRVWVQRMESGAFRITIRYTHIELGEYREAHLLTYSKEEANQWYQNLIKGAEFFLGDAKNNIHFHTPPPTPIPY
jgi:hypothetical protein